MEVVLVQKSGPVRSLNFKIWWVYFLVGLIVFLLAGIGVCLFLLYEQAAVSEELRDDNQTLIMRIERLEGLAHNEEARKMLSMGDAEQDSALPQKNGLSSKDPAAEEIQAAGLADSTSMAAAGGENKTQEINLASKEPEAGQILQAEPTESKWVALRNITTSTKRTKLTIQYEVLNLREPNDPAMGYTTVVMRGKQAGKAWVESYPRMKLTILGRPVNYRRGVPFSLKRYRRVEAKFQLEGKDFNRLEILVHSKEGKLVLVHFQNMK